MAPSLPKADAVVVVDPYSSGRYLLYELKSRNIPIICIRSSFKLGPFFLSAYEKNKSYFAATIDHADVCTTLEQLQSLPFEVIAVMPGCEPGVALADILAEALGLPNANGTELLAARKDKAMMHEQLQRCGVPAAHQVRSGDLQVLLEWTRQHEKWPVVVKPVCSSGSDGIHFCRSEDDIQEAYAHLIGTTNPNGNVVDELVVQEFLTGTEYIVDTVSHGGHHLCVAIWEYCKRKGTPWSPTCIICEYNDLLPSDGEVQEVLTAYIFKVLDAVGLKYGPCHSEVMLTPRGPILVEVNARLHGLQGSELIGLSTGISKATYAVDAMVGGAQLFEKCYVPPPLRYLYPLHRQCTQMILINPVEGYLINNFAETIEALGLPSVYRVLPSFQPGQYLPQSVDLNSAVGYVLLVHESQAQIREDMKQIRAMEDQGLLYIVSKEPPTWTSQPAPASHR